MKPYDVAVRDSLPGGRQRSVYIYKMGQLIAQMSVDTTASIEAAQAVINRIIEQREISAAEIRIDPPLTCPA